MADYRRSTTTTTLDGHPDPLRAALLETVRSTLLTMPEDDYVGLGPPDGDAARAALQDAICRAKA